MLSPEAKVIILHLFLTNTPPKITHFNNRKPSPRQQHAPSPHHAMHTHGLDYLTSFFHKFLGRDPPSDTPLDSAPKPSEGVTSVHEDIPEPDSQPLLAHVTKKKPMQPGNIKRLLSPAANGKPKQNSSENPQEVNVNGIIY